MKILIVGAGKIGVHLAKCLEEKGHEIGIIEKDPHRLKKALKYNTFNVSLGDGTNTKVLEDSNIKDVDVFISTSSNGEENMILCLMAKKLGAKMTICLCNNKKYLDHVEFMGEILNIDLIINSKLETARYIIRTFYSPEVGKIHAIDHGKLRLVSMRVLKNDELAGKSLMELKGILPKGMLVVEITRNGEVLIPKGEDEIKVNDQVHLLGSNDDFIRFFGRRNGIAPGETFFIVDGGLLSYFLVERLERFGHEVKVLEEDEELIQTLRRDFPNCEAVYAEQVDADILKDEGVSDYENLVLLSPMDESNIVLGSFAKSIGCKRIFSNLNSKELLKLDTLNSINMTFSEQEIVGNMVEQFIEANDKFQDPKIGTLKNIGESRIKIEEVTLTKSSPYIDKMISEIEMPKESLIAFISRKNKIIVPKGDDYLKAGDVLIVVSKKVAD